MCASACASSQTIRRGVGGMGWGHPAAAPAKTIRWPAGDRHTLACQLVHGHTSHKKVRKVFQDSQTEKLSVFRVPRPDTCYSALGRFCMITCLKETRDPWVAVYLVLCLQSPAKLEILTAPPDRVVPQPPLNLMQVQTAPPTSCLIAAEYVVRHFWFHSQRSRCEIPGNVVVCLPPRQW